MLKHTLLSLLFISLNISYINSQTRPNSSKSIEGAAIEFEETIQDFGEIQEGERFSTSYSFKNTGSEVLIIQNIKTSCKCVSATAASKEIFPGESATIDASYDSAGKGHEDGRAESKIIIVTTNADPQNSYLKIKGKVYSERNTTISQNSTVSTKPIEEAAIEFEETIQDFGEIEDGERYNTSYPFKNTGSEVLIIKNISSCKCISATASSKEIYPGDSATINVMYDSTNKGNEHGRPESKRITVTTNADPQNSYLTIKGKVYSDRNTISQNSTISTLPIEGAAIEYDKTIYDFGEIVNGDLIEYSFPFKNIGTEVLIIEKVKGSCKCLTGIASSKEVYPGESATIDFIYDSTGIGQEDGKRESKRITVITNADPQNSYLTIRGTVFGDNVIVKNNKSNNDLALDKKTYKPFDKSDFKAVVAYDENGKKSGEEKVYNTNNGKIVQINNFKKGQLHGVSQTFNDNGVIINELQYVQGKIESEKLNSKSDLKFVGEWHTEDDFTDDFFSFLFNNLGYAYMVIDDSLGPLRLMGGKTFNLDGEMIRMEFEVNDDVNPHHLDVKITQLESGKTNRLLFLASFIDDDTLKLAIGKSSGERTTEFTKENTQIFKRKKFY